ncbi:unnamed protein product [Rotaria sordida]|uniref:PPM-type phosphatase domain-containing protein n=1 Tax=Rotaria sordida TaxID=392033 RepID=A0A819UM66_9BILA|nr:unnamed protein product [Rotaria sordida]CAF4097972.1 unnamed protein product [Rotaria sordida]
MNLLKHIEDLYTTIDHDNTDIVTALESAFIKLDRDICAEAMPVAATQQVDEDLLQICAAGSCVCVTLVKDDDLYIANCGDARAVLVLIEQPPRTLNLPTTPITSCKVTVTSIYHIPKRENQQQLSPAKIIEHRELPISSQKISTDSNSVNSNLLTSHSDHFIYRARRVKIKPTIDFPPPPSDIEDIENKNNQQHDYEDMNTPFSSKRPSHNLLSNIVPSITTPSTDQSSQQSTKHIASSFGFDTAIESHHMTDTTTIHSNTDTYAQNDEQIELESLSSNDEDNEYERNQIDYLCKSTSTLGIASPNAHTYYA